MKVLVLDDEVCALQNFTDIIETYLERVQDQEVQVRGFSDEESFWKGFLASGADIVFLDIFLDGKAQGVEIARKIRKADQKCILIFVTSSPDFALEGYEVAATHYLVKPVQTAQLTGCFNRCRRLLAEHVKVIRVQGNCGELEIALDTIRYIEIIERSVNLFVRGVAAPLRVYEPLSSLEERLQDQRFLRTHRSYIVNMDYINKVKEESFQLDDGCEIPMRRRDRGELKKSFYSYMLYKTRQGIAR